MSAFEKGRERLRAMALLDKMKGDRIEMKAITCNAAASAEYKDLIGGVSTDFESPNSGTFDSKAGVILDPPVLKFVDWYVNKLGYSCRVVG